MPMNIEAHPFKPSKWYKLGELRRVAAEILGTRQADPALSAMMREQSEKWAKNWNEELYPLKVFADQKALLDDAEFCWTPDVAADFTIQWSGKTIKVQNTMAYAEWDNSIAEQGGHLHKLEMIESNKVGHSFPGGLVSKPNARSAETDVNAWRRGIIKAVKAKLKPKYAGIHLLIFAQHCRLQTIDFPFEQVVEPAIEQAGKTECEHLFAGVYVFDGQPPAIFELK
jgi:hypothetical protein